MKTTFRVKNMSMAEGMRCHISDYPNFSANGNVKGMKEKYYGKSATLVKCGGFIYNVPMDIYNLAH